VNLGAAGSESFCFLLQDGGVVFIENNDVGPVLYGQIGRRLAAYAEAQNQDVSGAVFGHFPCLRFVENVAEIRVPGIS
jgi:hypothetical protein